MTTEEFHHTIDSYRQAAAELEDTASQQALEYTARRLKDLHFSPTLIFPTENFLYFSKGNLLNEIERIAQLKEHELREAGFDAEDGFRQVKLEHIGLLLYHFKLLVRLRQDDPEAWDEIDELYGDD